MRLVFAFALLVPAHALADGDPPPELPATPPSATIDPPQPVTKDIVITVERDRSTRNKLFVGGLAGLGAIFGGVGLYYNLDSRDAAALVSPKRPTGQPWGPEQQRDFDRAHSSGVKAGVFYGIGGALLVASFVTLVVTDPGTDTTVIHPQTTIAPTRGGAFIARAWSF